MNRRLVAALAAAGILVVGAWSNARGNAPTVIATDRQHRIDLVAGVTAINADAGWSQNGGVTSGGTLQLTLDDTRVLSLPTGTLVDDYAEVPACADYMTPGACVLLADMLGQAVIWYALVPADKVDGANTLSLPGLVDMQANGDEGILRNGWVVRLATPVKRTCDGTDTSSLRDFITRFPDASSTSTVNMVTDEVVAVTCK